MISRKSTLAIAEAYTQRFIEPPHPGFLRSGPTVAQDSLYDFLYEHSYDPGFCNIAKSNSTPRDLKEWLLKIHTGESLSRITLDWPWDEREKLGQEYLKNLARDFMIWFRNECEPRQRVIYKSLNDELIRRLEMDGYVFRDGDLYQTEVEVLDVEEEKGLLQKLYASLELSDQQTTFQFLNLAEEHYVAGRWSDCIGNARKFFEAVLQQVASKHAALKKITLPATTLESPRAVRDYLENEGLIEKKEREAIDKIYALLSHTGGHPYMAEEDQARLLRQICLIVIQFVMLRLEGYLKKP
jgi:hypothetical protein